ncbi:electron transfer flavoprotein subunit alpha/FixB family protein [candidate division KSB1 bacterium]|nr:electron transfer flavoprotein subunit alpha/FixB family protein [candidate division KSB1 bacterium]
MSKPVFVITEQREGTFRKVTYEIVSEARRIADKLGSEVVALVPGNAVSEIAQELGQYGADKILVAENDILAHYITDAYRKVALEAIKQVDPDVILIAATAQGKDLAPRIAAGLGVALATDCTGLEVDDGKIKARRPMYANKILADHAFESSPQIASLRPNIFPAQESDAGKSASVETLDISLSDDDLKAKLKELVAGAAGKVDLTEADIIVSGGRGMKSPENYKILEDLADVVGGVVGASRAAVDAGWRPHAEQVGQTGKVVSPQLYIACGISGSIQHLAGMSSSKCIVAINKDPEAPIFEKADYGIVGDLFEVVPRLTEELKKVVDK